MAKVAISACLLGAVCRYDGTHNKDIKLLGKLEGYELVPFCPEDFCYGTPRPTMDLIETDDKIKAISNLTKADLTPPIKAYAKSFFHTHPDIEMFIGKDRSPSCGVCSARVYDSNKNLISSKRAGLMAQEAIDRGIPSFDAESFIAQNPSPPIVGS